MTTSRKTAIAAACLAGVTFIWGTTFVVVKVAIREIPVYEFLTIRFALGLLVLAPFVIWKIKTGAWSRPALIGGTLAGIAMAVGYATQTLGLQYTTATRSAFITGLTVVFAPLLSTLLFKRAPNIFGAAGILVSFVGLVLLTGGISGALGRGELLTLLTALSFGFHVVVLSRYSPDADSFLITGIQVAVCTVIFAVASVLTEHVTGVHGSAVIGALLLTGVAATAFAFFVLVWAQRYLSATATAVTLTMEPVFAGLTGYVFLHERLHGRERIGALLIFVAMLLADTRGEAPGEPGASDGVAVRP